MSLRSAAARITAGRRESEVRCRADNRRPAWGEVRCRAVAGVDFLGQNAATVAARPGWSSLAAVKAHHVIGLNDDIASRWGPRIVDLLRTVLASLKGQ